MQEALERHAQALEICIISIGERLDDLEKRMARIERNMARIENPI